MYIHIHIYIHLYIYINSFISCIYGLDHLLVVVDERDKGPLPEHFVI